jgi:exopolysaccharide production protein ExoZ
MERRLHTLDYLRGLSALGIMIYHFSMWAFGIFSPDSFMGKWGVYGVGIFYILSGLTLFHVYYNRMRPSADDLKDFFLKRIFRIFPLLWLTIFLTIATSKQIPGMGSLLANLTGVFGLIQWDGYIGTGTWSIGNELVFYLFFPVFVFLAKRSKPLFLGFSLFLFALFIYFAFYKLDVNKGFLNPEQWSTYVNPLNQVFLFLSGFLMGLYLTNMRVSNLVSLLLFMLALTAFYLYVPTGVNLSASVNRIVLSLLSFVICFAFYKNTLVLPSVIDRSLRLLGEASYSVYLLHPIVWLISLKMMAVLRIEISPLLKVLVAASVTLVIGYLNYKYFETFFIRAGKKLGQRFIKKTVSII